MGKKNQKRKSDVQLKDVLQGVEQYLLEVEFIATKDLTHELSRDDALVTTMRKEFAENMLQWFRFTYRRFTRPVIED